MFTYGTPRPWAGEKWGLDNGAFSYWRQGKSFDGDLFLRRVERAYRVGTPYLAVAPDIVAGGLRSLEFSLSWLEQLPPEWPWFIAVQDGMGLDDVKAVLDRFAGIFLGGTDRFKATAAHWATLARKHGKRFHYARAGTRRKLLHAIAVNANSLDSCLPLWNRPRFAQFVAWWEKGLPPQLRLWDFLTGAPRPGDSASLEIESNYQAGGNL